MIQQDHQLPRKRRCKLLSIPRSSSYYQPKPMSEDDLALMKRIDRIHMDKPFLGSRRIVDALAEQDLKEDRKRVQRLMRLMSIQAIHPGPKTSKPHPQHKIYPYRLRGLEINQANQVWASDVTYVPMEAGFVMWQYFCGHKIKQFSVVPGVFINLCQFYILPKGGLTYAEQTIQL